ncbi:hypothetical protein I6J18_06005 [Peribacillus psychrosaccharolyticus]|uniref:Uncharacterized protein n=1 Tax=Peribacillus psychrosaccharolyticus TaxID=1407 RepID=A0A974S2J3_PERPY|nr:hypothetical protein [Peribacillus psychrosaccharolyticus]MEC2053926.1 hypothetical protein [Peribacillus psychrosaccharolyticus]MED3742460.1 hypothetical protein [Peribacillus psychrosaccharolyticus]QQT01420.1 hypothetical protein I6J18_06005 [Peribacillus psychrosaccharolyticus]
MILKIIIVIIGVTFIGCGILYNRNYHEKHFVEGYSSSNTTNDSLIGTVLFFLMGFILSVLPWYVIKILLLLIGIFMFVVSVLYV